MVGRSERAGRYTREGGDSLYDRWRRNRFLYRWLGYCLHRGHRFQVSSDAADDRGGRGMDAPAEPADV